MFFAMSVETIHRSIKKLLNKNILELRYNQIIDVSPLSKLTNLTYLGLSGNQISDISPLSGITDLDLAT